MQFKTERNIMWGDLDALGIVFYPRYSEWFDSNVHQFFIAAGVSQMESLQQQGLIFGLVETNCQFHHPGRYDDRITIATHLTAIGSKTLDLAHRIVSEQTQTLMVTSTERRICLKVSDVNTLRAAVIPQAVRHRLEACLESPASHPS
ncbi:MAG: thioesterase family protein [Desulfosarcinaceae bacterium]|jgi:YbgC/YbaW family acyl-CoA thioester hydrolase